MQHRYEKRFEKISPSCSNCETSKSRTQSPAPCSDMSEQGFCLGTYCCLHMWRHMQPPRAHACRALMLIRLECFPVSASARLS